MEPQRRGTDIHIAELITKVELLDGDVKRLRSDFEDHSKSESMKIEMLSANLVTIQVKLDQLLLEIKEPMEAFKVTKYGMSFLKYIGDTAKWLVPLVAAVVLGYSALDSMKDKSVEKPAAIQQGK